MTQDMEYNTTASAMLQNLIAAIPENMDKITRMMDSFDVSKVEHIINIAKQTNLCYYVYR